jgi:hypothetical protein
VHRRHGKTNPGAAIAGSRRGGNSEAAVSGLPVFPPGMMSCPAFDGRGMRLTFRATPPGPTLAAVVGDTVGCGSVTMTIGGKPMLTLG